MALNATAEEEAIIKKRYLTQTAQTAANALPPFKRLTKRCAQGRSCSPLDEGLLLSQHCACQCVTRWPALSAGFHEYYIVINGCWPMARCSTITGAATVKIPPVLPQCLPCGTPTLLPAHACPVCRYLQFCQALEAGTAEDAERLHGELLADLYAVQVNLMGSRAQARTGGAIWTAGVHGCIFWWVQQCFVC